MDMKNIKKVVLYTILFSMSCTGLYAGKNGLFACPINATDGVYAPWWKIWAKGDPDFGKLTDNACLMMKWYGDPKLTTLDEKIKDIKDAVEVVNDCSRKSSQVEKAYQAKNWSLSQSRRDALANKLTSALAQCFEYSRRSESAEIKGELKNECKRAFNVLMALNFGQVTSSSGDTIQYVDKVIKDVELRHVYSVNDDRLHYNYNSDYNENYDGVVTKKDIKRDMLKIKEDESKLRQEIEGTRFMRVVSDREVDDNSYIQPGGLPFRLLD